MELASRQRSTAQTNMNERSSRSHSVFTLHLKATNMQQNVCLRGALSLVDLAGSERLDRSGATGARMKETVAINKSLSALTDVFVAIANKNTHVPFRNSKLTYLLQPALSGDGKTLMVQFHHCHCHLLD
jgi:kinesin family protein C1